jgi:hypothetical protein
MIKHSPELSNDRMASEEKVSIAGGLQYFKRGTLLTNGSGIINRRTLNLTHVIITIFLNLALNYPDNEKSLL